KGQIAKASSIVVRGQVQSMNQSFFQLGLGICLAVLLVYFLMVVNFQSWLDPLIILMALPGALAGILWALFVTGTTISVPALMGCIMAIGVATSNSILMITFANEQRHPEFGAHEAREAALLAGRTRLRPVLMTALAMLIGMLPMSLGLGEGGEQNAPLGRAVIGGLMVATFYTLFFVPVAASVADLTPAATTQAIQDSIIYARTSGYLARRHVDIGDRVTAGQLLAEVASPEVEQQLRQARADLQQSEKSLELQRANLDLARATMGRYEAADAEGAVAKQAVDQSVATFRTAQAAVAAAEANVQSFTANVQRL